MNENLTPEDLGKLFATVTDMVSMAGMKMDDLGPVFATVTALFSAFIPQELPLPEKTPPQRLGGLLWEVAS